MKKLTLSKGRAMACLILMCLLLAQACRKDRGYLPKNEINNGQLIQHTAIIKWFETSKYAQLVALDWKNARQGIVDGKNVVRIPTLNVDKITKLSSVPKLKNNSLSSNGISSGTANKTAATGNSGNVNYNPAHPPELFLIQDGPNGRINSFLLNFIPKSKNIEAGENGIWTGKLLEWNLTGDTVLVQQLERSVVKNFYAMKVGASSPSNLNSKVKNNKLQSLTSIKDKQVSGFFGWLIDKLGEFIGWAGSAFGLSTYQYYTYDSYNDSFDSEWRLDIDFSWLTGSGTPTTTPGTTVTIPPRPLVMLYTGAGLPIYESYAIGYNGGGSGNPGSYNPNDPNNFEPSPIDYGEGTIDDQPHGPNVNFNNLSAQYLINEGWVTGDANIAFINAHKEVADAFVAYTEKIVKRTQSDIDFVNWGTDYLNQNPNINIAIFKDQFMPATDLTADPDADNWSDPDNEVLTDLDQTVYQQYQDNQPWPTIDRVIPFEKFVPMRQIIGPDGNPKNVNCLILAKEQLGKVGYNCSGFLPGTQTFSIYTTQDGVSLTQTRKAISYMITSLSKKIPVLIGVDNRPGAPIANKDNSTDHYVVVVAMGTDEKGKYFQFMDSATNNPSTGASYSNRLYFDPSTGKITGKTAIVGYRTQAGMRDYTITQIRKSIKN